MNKEQCKCDDSCGCDSERERVVLVGASGEPIATVIDPDVLSLVSRQGMSPGDAAQIEQLVYELQEQAKLTDPCHKVYPTLRNERGEKLGRNDPCPCNSNKKWKNCCQKRL